jgi:phosphatidate cytidylyltransferase
MKTRLTTGVILGTAVICVITMAPPLATYILVQIAILIAADELFKMMLGDDGLTRDRLVGIAGVGALVSLIWFAPHYLAAAALIIPILILATVLYSPGEVSVMGKRATALLGGFAYLAPLAGSMIAILAHEKGGPLFLLLMLGGVFSGDTGAYFSGKFLGNAKLYEKISPKKTWAGAIGGLISSVGGLFLFSHLLNLDLAAVDCVMLGVGIAVLEQTGDLAESLFKRANNIKDSGSILPGHGGMMDRIDGVLFAAPLVWIWLEYML